MTLRLPRARVRPVVVTWLVGLLALQTGCGGGARVLSQSELIQPKPAKSYRVTTRDGAVHRFISLHLEGDWLVGTVRVTSRERVGEGETVRENVTNRYEEKRLPWSSVVRVEAVGMESRDWGFLLAAGAIAAGVGVFLLLTQESPTPPVGGGGIQKKF